MRPHCEEKPDRAKLRYLGFIVWGKENHQTVFGLVGCKITSLFSDCNPGGRIELIKAKGLETGRCSKLLQ